MTLTHIITNSKAPTSFQIHLGSTNQSKRLTMAVYLLSRYAPTQPPPLGGITLQSPSTRHPRCIVPHSSNVLNTRSESNSWYNNRLGDPLFALTMGVTAALTRIRRDQQEKNPERASEIGYGTVMQLGQRRLQRWWNGDFEEL